MKIKIIIVIILILTASAAYFFYPQIKGLINRYELETNIVPEQNKINPDSYSLPQNETQPKPIDQPMTETDENSELAGENITTEEIIVTPQDAFREIDTGDCDKECQDFSGDDKIYCQQVCGLQPMNTDSQNCDGLTGLKKDYCLKDLAFNKKDYKICDQITDSGIRNTCRNRITEEIFDNEL